MSSLNEVIAIAVRRTARWGDLAAEVCEHKGIGHPDSICDGVAEAVAWELCREYLRLYGEIRHFNVDKALLVGGASTPRFGGGTVQVPIRLIIAGRATPVEQVPMVQLAERAARQYIAATLRCDPALFQIECAIRPGSGSLRQVYAHGRAAPMANDTSIGAAYAPHSALEQLTLHLAATLRSNEFRSHFPVAGDDYKVMGTRLRGEPHFTVALALVDRVVDSSEHYFELKQQVLQYLEQMLEAPSRIELNTLDTPGAANEGGLYLTVTGLSAEQGDDGEVGRGNRINGLITPARPMSLEAVCGKNPVAHVGKLYNVLAREIAQHIYERIDGIRDVSIQIVSAIGRPIAQPQLVAIEIAAAKGPLRTLRRQIHGVVSEEFERLEQITGQLVRGEMPLF
jgi:S-adenosylmethionine synthetase